MPDYGLPLEFGTFLTPINQPALAAVEMAKLSEHLGYDLVTFQDHPYQASFHDTWTLLTWIAAQTETIQIAPNVMNLPLRPPAVAARIAAATCAVAGFLLMGLGGWYGGRLVYEHGVAVKDRA